MHELEELERIIIENPEIAESLLTLALSLLGNGRHRDQAAE